MGKWENDRWEGDEPTLAELDETECQCCGSSGVPLKVYRIDSPNQIAHTRRKALPPFKALCRLCANTMVGIWSDYPEQHSGGEMAIMKAICFVGNEILKRLDESKVRRGN